MIKLQKNIKLIRDVFPQPFQQQLMLKRIPNNEKFPLLLGNSCGNNQQKG